MLSPRTETWLCVSACVCVKMLPPTGKTTGMSSSLVTDAPALLPPPQSLQQCPPPPGAAPRGPAVPPPGPPPQGGGGRGSTSERGGRGLCDVTTCCSRHSGVTRAGRGSRSGRGGRRQRSRDEAHLPNPLRAAGPRRAAKRDAPPKGRAGEVVGTHRRRPEPGAGAEAGQAGHSGPDPRPTQRATSAPAAPRLLPAAAAAAARLGSARCCRAPRPARAGAAASISARPPRVLKRRRPAGVRGVARSRLPGQSPSWAPPRAAYPCARGARGTHGPDPLPSPTRAPSGPKAAGGRVGSGHTGTETRRGSGAWCPTQCLASSITPFWSLNAPPPFTFLHWPLCWGLPAPSNSSSQNLTSGPYCRPPCLPWDQR